MLLKWCLLGERQQPTMATDYRPFLNPAHHWVVRSSFLKTNFLKVEMEEEESTSVTLPNFYSRQILQKSLSDQVNNLGEAGDQQTINCSLVFFWQFSRAQKQALGLRNLFQTTTHPTLQGCHRVFLVLRTEKALALVFKVLRRRKETESLPYCWCLVVYILRRRKTWHPCLSIFIYALRSVDFHFESERGPP